MTLQKLYSYTRQAINDFNMIQDGDKIAIGVSGGKDSLTLLYALSGLQKFISEKIELVAITVDLGFGNFEIESVKELCNNLGIEYHVVKTQIADILKAKIKEGSFCSLCAKMRKGALNDTVKIDENIEKLKDKMDLYPMLYYWCAGYEFSNNKFENIENYKEKFINCFEISKDIEKYFTNAVVIGHNVASSDLDALVKNLRRYNLDIPEFYYICIT